MPKRTDLVLCAVEIMARVVVTLLRDRCIGCGYCADAAAEYFSMEDGDGKCSLAASVEKKGCHTLRTNDPLAYEPCLQAQQGCPAGAIRVVRVE